MSVLQVYMLLFTYDLSSFMSAQKCLSVVGVCGNFAEFIPLCFDTRLGLLCILKIKLYLLQAPFHTRELSQSCCSGYLDLFHCICLAWDSVILENLLDQDFLRAVTFCAVNCVTQI